MTGAHVTVPVGGCASCPVLLARTALGVQSEPSATPWFVPLTLFHTSSTRSTQTTSRPPLLLNSPNIRAAPCAQPRRISAISLCRRVAHESLNVHGSDVAYKIRFASTMTGGGSCLSSRVFGCGGTVELGSGGP